MILIFTTFQKETEAAKFGKLLLEKRLVACYNLFPVQSAYWWKGNIENHKEALMIIKTREENFEKVESFINKHSGYDIPEIVAVKPEKINPLYLAWLTKETTS